MIWLQRVRLIRNLLYGLFLANLTVLVVGGVSVYDYFSSRHELENQIQTNLVSLSSDHPPSDDQRRWIVSEIQQQKSKIQKIENQMILASALIFIFGIAFPWAIFRLLISALQRAKREVEIQVTNWIREWSETQSRFGGEPFRNVQFWLQMALLTGESLLPIWKHPMAPYLSEVLQIFRQELKKSSPAAKDQIPTNKAA